MKYALRILIVGLAVAIVALIALRSLRPAPAVVVLPEQDGLPVYSSIPAFSLTNQVASPYGTAELAGKVWAANFIFTRCPATCPVQTLYMGKLQRQLSALPRWDEIRLVSFSVDPEYDTPDVLAEYATEKGAEPGQWHFLTGVRSNIWTLSTAGFKLPVGEAEPDAEMPLFHSPMLVVVDQQSRIRGYFDGMTDEGISDAANAIREALAESTP